MLLKLFMNLKRDTFYVILLSIIGILWYMSLWGIFDAFAEHIEKKHRVPKWNIQLSVVISILIIVILNPAILKVL
jgi:hypothetical protein